MKNSTNKSYITILREKAEELLKNELLESELKAKTGSSLSESNALKLIQELEVHQVELELQNEELILARTLAQEAVEKYSELYNLAPTGYMTLSEKGEILELNEMVEQMLGKERSLLKNSSFGFFVSDDTKPIFRSFLDKIFESNAKENCDVILNVKDNLLINVRLTGIIVKNKKQCNVSIIDISEHIKSEAEINLKNEQLIKVVAEKDKFFSIIAHDLRNPLSSFIGLTQLMTEALPQLRMDRLKHITVSLQTSAFKLNRLLENLLHWARMQQGLIPYNPKLVLLLPYIEESIEIALESAKSKEIEMDFNIPDDIKVYTDTNILNTIIRNLISNALKFTPRGGKISLSAKTNDVDAVEISLKDTGIGMNREMVDDLFKVDVLSNRNGTEGEPSTGLGLMMCKDFIRKLGGKLWVMSEEEKGSTFYFTLPHNVVKEATNIAPPEINYSKWSDRYSF